MTSPMNSSGIVTSTRMIGSRIAGSAFAKASLTAIEPAILNAISDESTSWYEPSKRVDLDVDHRVAGVDARLERLADALVDRLDVLARDRAADDLVDELVAGALLGGSSWMTAWPYWPLPPVWRTKRPLPSAARRIVSR